MVNVTNAAREELRRILGTLNRDMDKHMRLAMPPVWEGPGDFGIVLDIEAEGDYVVELEGLKLLLVDQSLTESLKDAVLDFKDSSHGPAFTLDVF